MQVKKVRKTRKPRKAKELIERVRKPRLRKSKKQKLSDELPTVLSKRPVAIKLKDVHYDANIFVPMHTDTIVDLFFSNKGGIPKATNFIVIGASGSGKCVVGNTNINVYNKNTGERYSITIEEFHKILK